MLFKASVLLTLVFVTNVIAGNTRPLKENEIYTTCTSRCPITCENYENPPMCVKSCGPPGYQCKSGYYYRSDGECVLASECPGEHEIYTTCTSQCPPTCENYENPPMCIQSCGPPGYQCENGYYLRNDGECVLASECPGEHEIYSTCTSQCPATCENYKNPPMCIESCGPPGYECENNYYRRSDGECVEESECPGEHEIYTTCTSNCPATCENYKDPPMCILSCGPPGYECENNYYRRSDGECVQESEC